MGDSEKEAGGGLALLVAENGESVSENPAECKRVFYRKNTECCSMKNFFIQGLDTAQKPW